MILSPPVSSVGDPLGGRGYVTTRPICGPFLILSPALKRWGPPGGRGYVTTRAICGPPVIPSPALNRWGPPILQGLCYHPAHLWANSDSVPRPKSLGTPQGAGVMLPAGPFVGHFWFRTPPWSVGDPPYCRGYVTSRPICGPLLIPYPVSEALGTPPPPGSRGYDGTRVDLWATSDSVSPL